MKQMNSVQYWVKIKLPVELFGLRMKQLTALRKLVQAAFNAGKKEAMK